MTILPLDGEPDAPVLFPLLTLSRIKVVADKARLLPGETKVTQKLADVTTMIKHTLPVVDEVLNHKASPASTVITMLCGRQQQAFLQFTLLGFAEFGFASRRTLQLKTGAAFQKESLYPVIYCLDSNTKYLCHSFNWLLFMDVKYGRDLLHSTNITTFICTLE